MQVAAQHFLRRGVLGAPGHNSTKETFMRSAPRERVAGAGPTNVEGRLKEVGLPPRVAALYRAIGSPGSEYIFDHWVLLSLDFVRDQARTLRRNHDQNEVVDFAFCYAGMGHAVVCGYAPLLKKIFYRVDGGANGYEQEEHRRMLIAFRPREGATFFPEDHWFDTVMAQIGQEAYEPFNLPLTHLPRN